MRARAQITVGPGCACESARWVGQGGIMRSSKPSYVPRDFCTLPELFGRNPMVRFERFPDGDPRRGLAYARLIQHRFAVVVRGVLEREHRSRVWLAEQTGLDYTRLG